MVRLWRRYCQEWRRFWQSPYNAFRLVVLLLAYGAGYFFLLRNIPLLAFGFSLYITAIVMFMDRKPGDEGGTW